MQFFCAFSREFYALNFDKGRDNDREKNNTFKRQLMNYYKEQNREKKQG